MKVELTPNQAAVLRPLLEGQNPFDLKLIIRQVMKGNWPEPEKTFLLCTTIKATTGEKIRKLIQKERESSAADPAAKSANGYSIGRSSPRRRMPG